MGIFKSWFGRHKKNQQCEAVDKNCIRETAPKEQERPLALANLSPTAYDKLTLLLVDDNVDHLELVGHFLAGHGAHIDYAYNGQTALDMYCAAPEKYNGILMDIQMPILNGDEAARQIRNSTTGTAQTIVIVAMSGNRFPDDKSDSPFNAFLSKPFRLEELAHTIRQLAAPK